MKLSFCYLAKTDTDGEKMIKGKFVDLKDNSLFTYFCNAPAFAQSRVETEPLNLFSVCALIIGCKIING